KQLERMSLVPFDLDTHDYGWGTLQSYAVGAALQAGEAPGAFGTTGGRAAFREATEPGFARIYVTARAVSALFGIAAIALVFLAARALGGPRAGLMARGLLAVNPLPVLHAHYLTTDAALAFLLLAALRVSLAGRAAQGAFLGGLAVATKQVAILVAPVWLL